MIWGTERVRTTSRMAISPEKQRTPSLTRALLLDCLRICPPCRGLGEACAPKPGAARAGWGLRLGQRLVPPRPHLMCGLIQHSKMVGIFAAKIKLLGGLDKPAAAAPRL